MKPWIKRSLFGFAGAALIAGSLGGCAAHRFGSGDPAEFRAKMVDEKTAAVRIGSPDIIAAAADFFDNLTPAQQVKVREFMQRGGRRWRG